MGNAPSGNASEYWFEPNFNCTGTILKEFLEKLIILYPKAKEKIVKYFFRRACLHFTGK
jgi:hypothetical protein